jgi:hypothetical protein
MRCDYLTYRLWPQAPRPTACHKKIVSTDAVRQEREISQIMCLLSRWRQHLPVSAVWCRILRLFNDTTSIDYFMYCFQRAVTCCMRQKGLKNGYITKELQSSVHYGTHVAFSVSCVFISPLVTASNGGLSPCLSHSNSQLTKLSTTFSLYT